MIWFPKERVSELQFRFKLFQFVHGSLYSTLQLKKDNDFEAERRKNAFMLILYSNML